MSRNFVSKNFKLSSLIASVICGLMLFGCSVNSNSNDNLTDPNLIGMWLIDTEKTPKKRSPLCANLHFLDNNILSTTLVVYFTKWDASSWNNNHKWYTKNNILYTSGENDHEGVFLTLYKVSGSTLTLESEKGDKFYYNKTKDSKKAITDPIWK